MPPEELDEARITAARAASLLGFRVTRQTCEGLRAPPHNLI